jgi:hypothetical protein
MSKLISKECTHKGKTVYQECCGARMEVIANKVKLISYGNDYAEAFENGRKAGIDKVLELIEEMNQPNEEWIDMVEAAKAVGFSKMVSPRDFMDGKHFALTDLSNRLKEL